MAIGGWLGLGVAPFLTRKTDSNTIRLMLYIASPPVTAFVVTALFTILYGVGYFTNQVLTVMIRPDSIRSVAANMSIVLISFSGTITLSDILYRMKQQTIDVAAASAETSAEESEEDDEDAESTDAEETETSGAEEAETSGAEEAETSGAEEAETSGAEEAETSGAEEAETSGAEEAETSGAEEAETSAEEADNESKNEWKKTADFEKARNAPALSDKDDE